MNIFKRGLKKIKKAAAYVDPTSSKSFSGAGKYVKPVFKPVVATAAVGLTGGAAALVRPDLIKPAIQGYTAAAAVGGALMTGGTLAAAAAGVTQVGNAYAPAFTPPIEQATYTESGATVGYGGATQDMTGRDDNRNKVILIFLAMIAIAVVLIKGK